MRTALVPPLKWHGGKHYLAGRIVALMPAHLHYVEPYAGGLAVLLAKEPEGVSEAVNDLHRDLTNFWRVLQSVDAFERFRRIVEAVPFSEPEWQEARTRQAVPLPEAEWQKVLSGLNDKDCVARVQRAVGFFVACRQSLAGRLDAFAPLSRSRTRRRMNEQVSAWLTAVEGLPAVHRRLRRAAVLCRPAVEVIRSQDGPGTLFYCDPPYLHETRVAPDAYAFEMAEADHRELLDVLRQVTGKVMLSGYPSALYDGALAGWNRHTFDLPNNAAAGKAKGRETEVLWCNF
jgi:DNA adenine methylase